MLTAKPQSTPRPVRRSLVQTVALACALAGVMAGCGAGPVPSIGGVTYTNSSGVQQPAVTVLTHGKGSTYLMAVVANDPKLLGVDWVAECTSSLAPGTLTPGAQDPTCGSFTYAHTASGPVPSYYQQLTNPQPIVTQYTAPTLVPPGGSVTIVARATSDPAVTSSATLTIQ